MFSYDEKRKIAKAVEDVLRELDHPEMDNNNIKFDLHVYGRLPISWADITENRPEHRIENQWNEHAREVLKGLEPGEPATYGYPSASRR